jgi:L-ascorbate metabolism protein UlaG (beta-lactamase superfamily)
MSLKISRILHAGYVLQCQDSQIAFDPIFENPFSQNCYAFPQAQFDHQQIKKLKFDAVFISHYHDDHCSFESLNLLKRETPIYIYCLFDEMISMIKELGFTQVYQLEINKPVTVGPFEIIPCRALDEDVDSIFHIKAEGLNILNVVDSWVPPKTLMQLKQSEAWDIVLWPFQTMREIEVLSPSRSQLASQELPEEWKEPLRALNPRYIVPSSCQFQMENWSWYNNAFFPITYQQFKKEMGTLLPDSEVVRLNPSVSVVLDKSSLEFSTNLPWVTPIGEQNVDYQYKPNLIPPTTAEIAQHFLPLDRNQLQKIFEYCENGLVEKYNSMDPPNDEFFEKLRLWQLSLYDHTGQPIQFYYHLKGNKMSLVSKHEAPISWLTEVPISKLYAALEKGEALTSMYMRINDRHFDPHIEEDLKAIDILEDPLIRCLFSNVFGAYQKAQMKRLRT